MCVYVYVQGCGCLCVLFRQIVLLAIPQNIQYEYTFSNNFYLKFCGIPNRHKSGTEYSKLSEDRTLDPLQLYFGMLPVFILLLYRHSARGISFKCPELVILV